MHMWEGRIGEAVMRESKQRDKIEKERENNERENNERKRIPLSTLKKRLFRFKKSIDDRRIHQ